MNILSKKFYFDMNKYTVKNKNENSLIISDYYYNWLKTNTTGLDILKNLNGEKTLSEVIDTISKEYMLERKIIENDIIKFCNDSLKNGLIKEEKQENTKVEYDNRLKEIYIDITNQCNLNCIYCNKCSSKNSKDFISLERISQILEKAKEFSEGYEFNVNLTGGEPLLHEEFELILKKIKEYTNYIALWTNGILLDDSKIKIIKDYCSYVYLSIDDFDEESNDLIRGNGSYKKALDAAKKLNQAEINFMVSTTPTIYNIKNLENMFEFSRDIGAIGLQINNPIKIDINGKTLNEHFSFNEDQLYDIYSTLSKKVSIVNSWKNNKLKGKNHKQNMYLIIERYKCLNGIFNISKKSACGAGSNILSFDINGNVYPCNCLHTKGLTIDNISKLTQTEPIANIDELEECKNCEYKIICLGGCRAESLYFNNNLLSASPSCKHLKKMFNDIMWSPMKSPADKASAVG